MKKHIEKLKVKTHNFLRWTEQYTKTDMVYLAKGGFWLTLGQGISAISSFLLAIAFANLLPKETYGVYKYILSIAGLLAIPTLNGMNSAIIQATARGFEGSFIPAIKTKIRWGLLGGLFSLILSGYYYSQGNSVLVISFLIAAIFIPFMDSFGAYNALLQGKKLFKTSTQYTILSQLIAISSLIGTLFLTKNLFLIVLAYFTSWTLTRFIFLKITLKKFPPNQNQDPKTISYGKHLSLVGIVITIASYIDRLVLFHYLGATQLAIYSIAIAPPEQIKSIFKNLSILTLPKFAQSTKAEIRKTLPYKLFILFALLIGLIIAYTLAAPLLFKILFPKYIESVFYSQMSIFMIIGGMIPVLNSVLLAKQANPEIYKSNIYISVFQIIITLTLGYLFGIIGVITAKISVQIFGLISSFWFFIKVTKNE